MHVLDGQAADELDGGRGPEKDRRGQQRPGADALRRGEKELVEEMEFFLLFRVFSKPDF